MFADLNREEAAFWDFLQRPPDAYSLQVKAVRLFAEPLYIGCESDGRAVGLGRSWFPANRKQECVVIRMRLFPICASALALITVWLLLQRMSGPGPTRFENAPYRGLLAVAFFLRSCFDPGLAAEHLLFEGGKPCS